MSEGGHRIDTVRCDIVVIGDGVVVIVVSDSG